ncbi:MAG TPA: branched-chain amino acid aminotransferase [Geminicoccaceae bacterium]|nr:branched-chain amino acid aminotransferase [Geminicoccaceae bacterium]
MAAAIFWHGGRWYQDQQPKLLGPMDHAMWMASLAFDGARAFDGLAPDLDRHCARLIDSTRKMLLEPTMDAEAVEDLCRQAIGRLPQGLPVYVRPMFYATRGFVTPEPDSTEFALAVYGSPMPEPGGISVCFSSYRRPARDAAPTDAKAGCLYPNMQRALVEASARGFDNGITLDASANVAELATANLWIVRDGVALTPACNGTFLNGITRQRVIKLLREAGTEVQETTLTRQDILDADEVFSTGNYGKVLPITRVEDRHYQAGRIYQQARELYFEFARTQPV